MFVNGFVDKFIMDLCGSFVAQPSMDGVVVNVLGVALVIPFQIVVVTAREEWM